jgi:hypothetical protein
LGTGGTLEAIVQKKFTSTIFAISVTCALSLPAQAAPNRTATAFWGEMLRWVESFWEGRSEWGEKLGPLSDPNGTAPATPGPDKLGPLIDPNGSPAVPQPPDSTIG